MSGSNSVAWCATFSQAWDESKKFFGGPIELEGCTWSHLKPLNEESFDASILPADGATCITGVLNQETIDLINAARKGQGFEQELPLWMEPTPLPSFITYSQLVQQLAFEPHFARSRGQQGMKFHCPAGVQRVAFFGFPRDAGYHFRGKARVLRAASKTDIIVDLLPVQKDTRIVLAMIPEGKTLAEKVERVNRYLAEGKPEAFRERDSLTIPILRAKGYSYYRDEINFPILNEGFKDWEMKGAGLEIQFRMDDKGVVLKSAAFVGDGGFGPAPPPPPPPRDFNFNKPFLLGLWKKDAAAPYFAMWVNSPDVLLPVSAEHVGRCSCAVPGCMGRPGRTVLL